MWLIGAGLGPEKEGNWRNFAYHRSLKLVPRATGLGKIYYGFPCMCATMSVAELTPAKIVAELDKYIIGQKAAKRAVANAVRNRWRRLQLSPEIARDVLPKNIMLIGPTGVGKTEIARRLATLVEAPFIKVEATKYTEVGYVGRDVESMIRDLLESAIRMVRAAQMQAVAIPASKLADERLVELLLPLSTTADETDPAAQQRRQRSAAKIKSQLAAGVFDDQMVEVPVVEKSPAPPMFGMMGMDSAESMPPGLNEIFEKLSSGRSTVHKVKVTEARKILAAQEAEKLVDQQGVVEQAISLTEQSGIIFLDEIDKVATGGEGRGGADVSRQGVQRDLLPIVEGSAVTTRHGTVHTDHILFIAAGAFHAAKPSDLMPELQGRFPIRVELSDLEQADYVRILREPKNSLVRQQIDLLAVEGVRVSFTDDAIYAMAEYAYNVNRNTQNIGARRLNTILDRVMDDLSFMASEIRGEKHVIDATMVREKLADIASDEDLSRYVL